MNNITTSVRGVGAEIRAAGYCWRATVRHLGGGGTDYAKFNGRWIPVVYDSIPPTVYRQLRAALKKAIRESLPQ